MWLIHDVIHYFSLLVEYYLLCTIHYPLILTEISILLCHARSKSWKRDRHGHTANFMSPNYSLTPDCSPTLIIGSQLINPTFMKTKHQILRVLNDIKLNHCTQHCSNVFKNAVVFTFYIKTCGGLINLFYMLDILINILTWDGHL